MRSHVFLTGATGFIGSGILQKWLTDEPEAEIAVLVRTRRGVDPQTRLRRLLPEIFPSSEAGASEVEISRAEAFPQRVSIVEGDISLDRFGLTDSAYGDLAARTTHIIHCAAAVRFDLPLEEARAINVAGSENVVALGRRCAGLRRIDYVGTAYVAGRRTGTVKESELDLGQEHNNTYERTKLESELLMRKAMKDLPITIYRPSIVICDSRTGRISRYSAIFRMLKAYDIGQLPALPGSPSTLLDLVPMDYVADLLHAIASRTESLGSCFHLTAGSENLTSLALVAGLASEHFGRPRFQIVPPEVFEAAIRKREAGLSEAERDLLEEIGIYRPYLAGDLRFDNSNVRALLGTSYEAPPPLASYFARMSDYIRQTAD